MQNKILTVKSLFSFAVKIGYLSVNVGSFIKAPKVKETLSQRILTPEDCRKIINAAPSERDRCLLSLMYGCGLRVSEVCGLTWADLREGCNLRLLQQSLGHSKLETTEKYLHINPDEGSSQFIDI